MAAIDNLGNLITFKQRPKKIISLVPAISETLYDLNLEELVLGVTKNCIHPAHFKHTKALLGTPHDIDLEKIKELEPDLVLCNIEENSLETIKELQKTTNVYVTNIKSIADSKQMITNFGLMLNRRMDADLLNRKIDLKLSEFNNYISHFSSKKIAYFTGYNPWLIAGGDSYTNHLLEINKLENIYQNFTNGSEINPKRIRHDGDPEILFFPTQPYSFKDKHAFEISEYTNRSSAVFVDGEMFSSFGSRLIKAFDYFKALRERLNDGASFLK